MALVCTMTKVSRTLNGSGVYKLSHTIRLAGFESSGGVEDEIEADDDVDQAEYEVEEEEGEGEEEDMARAMEQSRYDAYFGGDHAAGPSAAAPAYAPSVDPSSFSVMPSAYYQPGSVFKLFWCEPRGKQKNGKSTTIPTALPTDANFHKNFYTGVRRFIIIATDESHHSTCVPILTYERRACTKPGIQPGTHGIIYSQGHRPTLLQGERDLGFQPVSCTMLPHHTLDKESRVNYSKLTTIEHNVAVQFIGYITDSDFITVTEAVDECWGKKNRNTRNPKSKPKDNKPHKSKPPKSSRPRPESEPKHRSGSSKTSTDKKHSKKTH
ncbi:hypothetical protein PG999_011595 [Apiospora kogelbergensis]|uniref:DUF6590 domain-containing protein n=1 Tax=Apiospora kogelbergensis TaxID=1337665 RepID=A0AAW0QFV4_9PEZI